MKLSRYIREDANATRDKVLQAIRQNCGPWIKNPQADGFLYRGNRRNITNIERVRSRLEDRRPKDMPESTHRELNRLFTKKFGWPIRNGVFTSSNINNIKNYHHGGDPDIFIPIGPFEFVWSPVVEDLFTDYWENDKLHSIEQLEDWYYGGNYNITNYYVDGRSVYDGYGLSNWFSMDVLEKIDLNEPGVHHIKNKTGATIHKLEITKLDFYEFTEHYFPENKSPEDVVDLYTDRNLRDAIKSGNEVCFKCDEYYLIERKFEEDILEAFYT